MFDWIVNRINEGLSVNDPDAFTLGVLDIYGFEIFQVMLERFLSNVIFLKRNALSCVAV